MQVGDMMVSRPSDARVPLIVAPGAEERGARARGPPRALEAARAPRQGPGPIGVNAKRRMNCEGVWIWRSFEFVSGKRRAITRILRLILHI